MRSAVRNFVLLPFVLLASCHGHEHAEVVIEPLQPRPVSILVEVYDPATNLVWENVAVRIVEADNEWSGCTCESPFEDWGFTDATGQILVDEFWIGDAEVGFVTASDGAALLGPRQFEDEATVWLQIDALGFTPKFVPVDLSWSEPDVFIAVPFN